jgi:hypothetical protein
MGILAGERAALEEHERLFAITARRWPAPRSSACSKANSVYLAPMHPATFSMPTRCWHRSAPTTQPSK